MRAILVSVGYSDLLAITLPYNRHHFDEVMVVTDKRPDLGLIQLCQELKCRIWATDAFYDGGAPFNKWKALEQGLDAFGRHGWLCLMDADVLWPKDLGMWCIKKPMQIGYLYGPLRRMWNEFPTFPPGHWNTVSYDDCTLPHESCWSNFPLHRNVNEWAGYSQIFHAEDPHLGPPPWHEVDWIHAGGADSFFQQRWPMQEKVRTPWECLHLGPAGVNWMGRASLLADGSSPRPDAAILRQKVEDLWIERRKTGFTKEKLP